MTAVFVLRLVSDALAKGRIAGQVEVVADGRVVSCASADELVAALLQSAAVTEDDGLRG